MKRTLTRLREASAVTGFSFSRLRRLLAWQRHLKRRAAANAKRRPS